MTNSLAAWTVLGLLLRALARPLRRAAAALGRRARTCEERGAEPGRLRLPWLPAPEVRPDPENDPAEPQDRAFLVAAWVRVYDRPA